MIEPESLNTQVVTEIRVELARQNMQQSTLAKLCGLTPSSFSRRMTGEIPFTTNEVERIARELGLKLDQLMRPVTR